jgi:hypothetical protein
VGRLSAIAARLARLLALAERALEERVGAAPEPALLERHLAFRWDARRGAGRLVPIEAPALFDLDDLVGVERAVSRLVANVEQFVSGLPSNHVLLYGERGTGKSSAVRGLLPRFGGRGLRIVEVEKQDLIDLPAVLAALRGAPQRVDEGSGPEQRGGRRGRVEAGEARCDELDRSPQQRRREEGAPDPAFRALRSRHRRPALREMQGGERGEVDRRDPRECEEPPALLAEDPDGRGEQSEEREQVELAGTAQQARLAPDRGELRAELHQRELALDPRGRERGAALAALRSVAEDEGEVAGPGREEPVARAGPHDHPAAERRVCRGARRQRGRALPQGEERRVEQELHEGIGLSLPGYATDSASAAGAHSAGKRRRRAQRAAGERSPSS